MSTALAGSKFSYSSQRRLEVNLVPHSKILLVYSILEKEEEADASSDEDMQFVLGFRPIARVLPWRICLSELEFCELDNKHVLNHVIIMAWLI